nr:MAG TPA: hypothetical protein [Caudoviricetes sp.]
MLYNEICIRKGRSFLLHMSQNEQLCFSKLCY